MTVTSSIVKNQFKLFTSAITMVTAGAQSGAVRPQIGRHDTQFGLPEATNIEKHIN